MNLISCNYCGIVLDKSKLSFPKDILLNDGSVDIYKSAGWNGKKHVPKVYCPVCNSEILKEYAT